MFQTISNDVVTTLYSPYSINVDYAVSPSTYLYEVVHSDPRRWMTGRYPPPIEVALASLPLPELEPACELPRQPSRMLARARGRRPMRGRPGRPHQAA